MSTLLPIKYRTMNISEYENFVHSIKPLPKGEAIAIERLFKRLGLFFPMLVAFDVVGISVVIYSVVSNDLSTYVYIILAVSFLLMCVPFYIGYRIYKRYAALLIPYGLNVFDVSTSELGLDDYRKLSTVSNPEALKIIKVFIEYREGVLLDIDLKALKLDEYFEIESPQPNAAGFSEKRNNLVEQILIKVESANL